MARDNAGLSEINKGLNTSHRFLEGSSAWKEATTDQTASPACGYPPVCRLNTVQAHQLRLTQGKKTQTAPVSNVTAVLITYKQEETGLKGGGAN